MLMIFISLVNITVGFSPNILAPKFFCMFTEHYHGLGFTKFFANASKAQFHQFFTAKVIYYTVHG